MSFDSSISIALKKLDDLWSLVKHILPSPLTWIRVNPKLQIYIDLSYKLNIALLSRGLASALTEEDLRASITIWYAQYRKPKISRANTLLGQFHIIIHDQVCEHQLELAGGEEATRACMCRKNQKSIYNLIWAHMRVS